MSGPLIIDEAIDASKVVLDSSSSAILLTLMPMRHTSTLGTTVTKNRRQLEDLMMKSLALVPV